MSRSSPHDPGLHSSSQNIATTMCFGEWLDCGLCVVQHHVRQRSVREKPSPSWHTSTHTHISNWAHVTHTNVLGANTHTCTLTHSTHTYKYLCTRGICEKVESVCAGPGSWPASVAGWQRSEPTRHQPWHLVRCECGLQLGTSVE